jgi:hypothetical protein
MLQITMVFATDEYHCLHPVDSNPVLYWDQLNVISKIKHDINLQAEQTRLLQQQENNITQDTTQAFIRILTQQHNSTIKHNQQSSEPKTEILFMLTQLKQHDDWPEWQKSRYKQLNQFHEQGMFGDLMIKPTNAYTHYPLFGGLI